MSQTARAERPEIAPVPSLSIVVPVFNEQDSIRRFLSAARPAIAEALALIGTTATAEFVFVDDGSSDRTFELLRHLVESHDDIRIVRLSRNFGKEAALAAGLRHASGSAVIPMDVDLQDPPHLISDMVARWRDGAKVVNARRCDRTSDTMLKRGTARGFYRVYNRIADQPIPDDVGDFRLLDRRVVDTLNGLEESARFNKGLFSWVGFPTETVEYTRAERAAGTSKWHYWRLWRLAVDGITSSSTMPLRVWTYIGGVIAVLAMAYAAFLVIMTLTTGNDVPGYTSTIVAVLFLGGLNLLSLGIMGEYVGRIANEVRRRPLFIVDRLEGF